MFLIHGQSHFQWVGKTYISEDGIEDNLERYKRDKDRLVKRERDIDK